MVLAPQRTKDQNGEKRYGAGQNPLET